MVRVLTAFKLGHDDRLVDGVHQVAAVGAHQGVLQGRVGVWPVDTEQVDEALCLLAGAALGQHPGPLVLPHRPRPHQQVDGCLHVDPRQQGDVLLQANLLLVRHRWRDSGQQGLIGVSRDQQESTEVSSDQQGSIGVDSSRQGSSGVDSGQQRSTAGNRSRQRSTGGQQQ